MEKTKFIWMQSFTLKMKSQTVAVIVFRRNSDCFPWWLKSPGSTPKCKISLGSPPSVLNEKKYSFSSLTRLTCSMVISMNAPSTKLKCLNNLEQQLTLISFILSFFKITSLQDKFLIYNNKGFLSVVNIIHNSDVL